MNKKILQTLSEKGFVELELSLPTTQKTLSKIKKEHFIKLEDNNNPFEKIYKNRYISKSQLLDKDYIEKNYHELSTEIKNILKTEKINFSLFLGTKDYEMSKHNDIADKSIFNAVIYFNEEEFNSSSGGEIIFYKNIFKENKIIDSQIIKKIYPKKGKIILIDSKKIEFSHEVKKLKLDYKRYYFFLNIGYNIKEEINLKDNNIIKGKIDSNTIKI